MSESTENSAVPNFVTLDPELKKVLLAGAKFMLARFKQKNLMEDSVEYRDVLSTPELMAEFISVFKSNMKLASDLAVDRSGRPVTDDKSKLVCGATLAEIERLFVYTCASKVFAKLRVNVKKKKVEIKKRFAFFWKKGTNQAKDGKQFRAGELKLRELRPFLAYAWQLPLLNDFAHSIEREHYRALGNGLLRLDTPEKVKLIGSFDPEDIEKAKLVVGKRFHEMMAKDPGAIIAVSRITKLSQFELAYGVLGERIWEFFARGEEFVCQVLELDEYLLWAIGPSLADVSFANIEAIKPLNPKILKLFLQVFRETFEADAGALLAVDDFSEKFLKGMVGEFTDLKVDEGFTEDKEGAVADVIAMKWDTAKPKILKWHAELESVSA